MYYKRLKISRSDQEGLRLNSLEPSSKVELGSTCDLHELFIIFCRAYVKLARKGKGGANQHSFLSFYQLEVLKLVKTTFGTAFHQLSRSVPPSGVTRLESCVTAFLRLEGRAEGRERGRRARKKGARRERQSGLDILNLL